MKNNLTKQLKVGLVGIGEQMIDNLIPSILLSNKCLITSICDINENVLLDIKYDLNINKIYKNYEEMLNNENLDIVFVASSPDVHYNVLKLCINKKIAVFVEKPPVRNLKQLQDLLNLNTINNVPIGVGMNFSYSESHYSIKKLINDKDFGNISSISIEHLSSKPIIPFWNFQSIIESFLLAQMIHPLDYILRLGGDYKKINVFCSKKIKPFYISIVIEFENNIIGHIKSGSFYPRFKHSIEIISDNSNIINVDDLAKIEYTSKNINLPINLNQKKCNIVNYRSPLKSGYTVAGYSDEINNFINFYLQKENQFETTLSSMTKTYIALDDIYKKISKITNEENILLENG